MTNRGLIIVGSLAIALLAGRWDLRDSNAQPAPAAPAAPTGFKRVELQRHDLPMKDREAITARGEFQPGAVVPRHSHPGEEIGYVVEGELTLEIDGKPAQKLKAGEAFFIPAGTVHSAKNAGKAGAAVVSTYLVEKGKPLATPAK